MDDNLKNTASGSVDANLNLGNDINASDSTPAITKSAESADPALAGIGNAIKNNDTMQNAITTAATNDTDITTQMAEKIIKEQEGIIGPVAYEQATKVQGIIIDQSSHHVKLEGDKKVVLENLVKQYEQLFGRISIAICKEAVRGVIANVPTDQVPQILL